MSSSLAGSPLQGGRKRRTPVVWAAIVLGSLAPVAAGAAAYWEFIREPPRPSVPLSARSVAVAQHRAQAQLRRQNVLASAPVVRLSAIDSFRLRLPKPPKSALLLDVGNGEVLWRREPLRSLPIASLTKIMTALLVTERTRPDERALITRETLRYSGSGIGVLQRGKRVPVEGLLNGLLIVSGNDAAIALAGHIAGNHRRFVRLMNRRARQLGLRCTHFVSAHGLEPGNRSCARDLAVLTRLAMTKPRIRRIVARGEVSFPFPMRGGRLFLSGHNPLMQLKYRGVIGLKTGNTDEAGMCFVGVARRGNRTLAAILIDSPDPGRQAARMLDAGFRRG